MRAFGEGASWRVAARSLFGGQGSLGNGSAMRVAPIGAYFSDDLDQVVDAATASASVTHAHPEGEAGAIAVAIAAAYCCRERRAGTALNPMTLFSTVLQHVPASQTRSGIEAAAKVALDEWEYTAADLLGNGQNITAMDTVPFCLWVSAAHLDDYEQALWATVRVLGDIDTNCAIVGGIVSAATGREGIPAEWLRSRESLDLRE